MAEGSAVQSNQLTCHPMTSGRRSPSTVEPARRLADGIIKALLVSLLLAATLVSAACSVPLPVQIEEEEALVVSLSADGRSRELRTTAANIRELLAEAEVTLGELDLVAPPLYVPLSDGLQVTVTRVSERVELVEETIPFSRRTVRNESMSADEPPIIIQAGKLGLTEVTIRLVFHNGEEYSRQQTSVTVIQPPQDEIVMIGVGSGAGNISFVGTLAYISAGNSVILRGNSAFPEPINTGGLLDQRVFSLSPDGRHLLYTRVSTDTEAFNMLWVVETERGATPRALDVRNVLWAGWNPAEVDRPQIAYTTGVSTDLLPGWEANNDLWLGDLQPGANRTFEGRRLFESYPATYGWWGGNYAWSPNGRYIAYAFADEVGILDTEASAESGALRRQLQTFPEYNTRSDWVWVPSLSWSPDGRYLAYTRHADEDPDVAAFDTWVTAVEGDLANPFVVQTGMWSHSHWSPQFASGDDDFAPGSQLALLRATNPLDSQRSSYSLWIMDRDGSNLRQLYPPPGEISRFPREQSFMVWGPDGQEMAFVFNNRLHIMNMKTGDVRVVTQDDSIASNPTWAPYGEGALAARPAQLPERPRPTPSPTPSDLRLPSGDTE